MRTNTLRTRALQVALATLLIGAGLSCTNSDEVRSANTNVMLQVELTNAGSRYEFALVSLAQIQVLPLDTQAQQALGTSIIGTLPPSAFQELDLNQTSSIPPTEFVLGTGTYQITRVVLGSLILLDQDFAADDMSCSTQNFYEPGPSQQIFNVNLGSQYQFQITGGDQATLNVEIDSQAFINALENTFQGTPPACSQINIAALSALAPTYLSVSSQ